MLGIIPCGGKGSRWGGQYKELLPLGKEKWVIDCCVDQMKSVGVKNFCIVSSLEKAGVLAQHFSKEKYFDLNIFFVTQKYNLDMWGAILSALPLSIALGGRSFFAMPDTFFGDSGFMKGRDFWDSGFSISLFDTQDGSRFGVYDSKNGITNKNPEFKNGNYRAWGNFSFDSSIAREWMNTKFMNYTEALNYTLNNHETYFNHLDYYYDFATFEEYKCYLEHT